MSYKYKQLTDTQRYQIEAYLKSGMRKRFIAEKLEVNPSTIYRELKRNISKRRIYNAKRVQCLSQECYDRAIKFDKSQQKKITDWLTKEQWFAKQIVGDCLKQGITMVSHERIYLIH